MPGEYPYYCVECNGGFCQLYQERCGRREEPPQFLYQREQLMYSGSNDDQNYDVTRQHASQNIQPNQPNHLAYDPSFQPPPDPNYQPQPYQLVHDRHRFQQNNGFQSKHNQPVYDPNFQLQLQQNNQPQPNQLDSNLQSQQYQLRHRNIFCPQPLQQNNHERPRPESAESYQIHNISSEQMVEMIFRAILRNNVSIYPNEFPNFPSNEEATANTTDSRVSPLFSQANANANATIILSQGRSKL
ncbi:4301_t:CDS:1, partial [Cetraspora pellucida]